MDEHPRYSNRHVTALVAALATYFIVLTFVATAVLMFHGNMLTMWAGPIAPAATIYVCTRVYEARKYGSMTARGRSW